MAKQSTKQQDCIPYTHAMHALRCCESAHAGVSAFGLWVQVKKRSCVYCARIAAPWTTPDGLDCWTVEAVLPEVARFTVPVRQVRLCGQSDCACVTATELATATAAQADVLGAP